MVTKRNLRFSVLVPQSTKTSPTMWHQTNEVLFEADVLLWAMDTDICWCFPALEPRRRVLLQTWGRRIRGSFAKGSEAASPLLIRHGREGSFPYRSPCTSEGSSLWAGAELLLAGGKGTGFSLSALSHKEGLPQPLLPQKRAPRPPVPTLK